MKKRIGETEWKVEERRISVECGEGNCWSVGAARRIRAKLFFPDISRSSLCKKKKKVKKKSTRKGEKYAKGDGEGFIRSGAGPIAAQPRKRRRRN